MATPHVPGSTPPSTEPAPDLAERAEWPATPAMAGAKVMVGPTMRRARELAGLERSIAATGIGVRTWDLRVIESGRRGVDVAVVERALHVYGADDVVLPPRQDLVHPNEPDVLIVGDERVPIDPLREDDAKVLEGYVAAVRRQRGLDPGAVVRFRSHDLVQLATVLDLSSADLATRLHRIAGLDGDPAIHAARRIVLTGLALSIVGVGPQPTARFWTPAAAGLRLYDAERRAATGEAMAAESGPAGAGSDRAAGTAGDSSWLARGGRPASTAGPLSQLQAIAALENLVQAASTEQAAQEERGDQD